MVMLCKSCGIIFPPSHLELINEINITSPCVPYEETSIAGDNHTLTCTVNSDLPANLKWVRIIDGEQFEVENTSTITISKQIVSDNITKKRITFKPLLTSHGGRYVCVSVLTNMAPKLISTKELEYEVKVKSKYLMACINHHLCTKLTNIIILFYLVPPPTVQLISDTEAVTSKYFPLIAFINLHPSVDTPINIDSSWYGHPSLLDDGQRVIISDMKGQNFTYNRSVLFVPLISSDEGSYFFSARVKPLDSQYIFPSSFVNDSINISPSKCTLYTITIFLHIRIICSS